MKDETIKAQLLERINQLLDKRMVAAEQSILAAIESRDSDTKSSAGDKYETGREMIQQELDKQEAQLAKNRALKNDLLQINRNKKYQQVEFGSLVICDSGKYFLSLAIGRIGLDGTDYFCLSMASPLGQALWGKQVGEMLVFNGKSIVVEEIF